MKIRKALALVLALALVFLLCGCESSDYKKALGLYEAGDYEAAESAFLALGDYKDAADQARNAAVKICEKWIDDFNAALKNANENFKAVTKQETDDAVAFSGTVCHEEGRLGHDNDVRVNGAVSLDRKEYRFDWTIEGNHIGWFIQGSSVESFSSDLQNFMNFNINSFNLEDIDNISNIMYFAYVTSDMSGATDGQVIEAVFSSAEEAQSVGEWTIKTDISEDGNLVTFHVDFAG